MTLCCLVASRSCSVHALCICCANGTGWAGQLARHQGIAATGVLAEGLAKCRPSG